MFFWWPSVGAGVEGVVVVMVRLEPVLDVVVVEDVDERDEVEMDSEGVDNTEDNNVEEFADVVVIDEVVDTENDKVEEITGMVIAEVEEITGIVIADDDRVVVTAGVVERAEVNMVSEEVDTRGKEMEEITGIVITDDDGVAEDSNVLVDLKDDDISGRRDVMNVREDPLLGVLMSVLFFVPDDRGDFDNLGRLKPCEGNSPGSRCGRRPSEGSASVIF